MLKGLNGKHSECHAEFSHETRITFTTYYSAVATGTGAASSVKDKNKRIT